MTDPTIEVPGPWNHRYVAANGARFHVAELAPARSGPLVLLLHGFPEFWWAWRHQLEPLASAGYRVVAMDLRGYGASDKTPRGYDAFTLAGDVAGLIRALGARDAVLVGQGWGGYVAWTVATAHPGHVRALCTVAAPHPAELLAGPARLLARTPALHLLTMQVPWLPERRIMRGSYVGRHLSAWSAPDSAFPTPDVVSRYRAALAIWPSPHCALEYHRWLFRSRFRRDGRAYSRLMGQAVEAPVLQIVGAHDHATDSTAVAMSGRHVAGPYSAVSLPRAGHFPHEERPEPFNEALLSWLSQSAGAGVD
jgi:pimeloyl-ACP methyl ester carboxylesterase